MINLTQHNPSGAQKALGVKTFGEFPEVKVRWSSSEDELRRLLTFETLPSALEIGQRAMALADLAAATGEKEALIGGAPFFMGPLADQLGLRGITPFFAFSQRETHETVMDGKAVKTSVFSHKGFIKA